jgi:hypothetical protein
VDYLGRDSVVIIRKHDVELERMFIMKIFQNCQNIGGSNDESDLESAVDPVVLRQ